MLTCSGRELLLDGNSDRDAAGREAIAGARAMGILLRDVVDLLMCTLDVLDCETACAVFAVSISLFLILGQVTASCCGLIRAAQLVREERYLWCHL